MIDHNSASLREAPVNPYAAAARSRKMLTLVGIYVCVVGCIFQSATASTLLPVAAAEIGGLDYYSLANTLNGAVGVVAMPLWGLLAAKNPAAKRPLFLLSMASGLVCLVGRAMAPDMMTMVVVSLFWGLPSAGLYVVGYSVIRDMFDERQAGMYLGVCATMQSLGMLVGPVLGGAIMDFASWRLLCAVIAIVIMAGMVLYFLGVKVGKDEAAAFATAGGSFDALGSVAVAVFLGSLLCGLSMGTSFLPFGGAASNAVFALAVGGMVVLAFDIRKKKDAAVVPVRALKDRNTLLFSVACFATNFSNMAVFFFVPMYVINAMGLSATEAGLTTTLLSVAGLFMGPIFGRMIGKSGTARGVLTFGSALRAAVALILLALMAPDTSIFIVYAIMFVGGFYNVTCGVVFSAGPQIQIPEKTRVQGNSVIQLSQNLGGAVGTAVYSIILSSMGVVSGMPLALCIAAATALVALVAGLFLEKLHD